jgi:2-polyprenyl-6-methoxyphenol hydroxylase-like FAD-dependent oxidoreductase
MCFKNLPIEFDAQGTARLKPGIADPYSFAQGPLRIADDRDRIEELFEDYDSVRRVDVDRVTRVADGSAVDLQALLELVDQGCAPELAVRIVAPLAWQPPTHDSPLTVSAGRR